MEKYEKHKSEIARMNKWSRMGLRAPLPSLRFQIYVFYVFPLVLYIYLFVFYFYTFVKDVQQKYIKAPRS